MVKLQRWFWKGILPLLLGTLVLWLGWSRWPPGPFAPNPGAQRMPAKAANQLIAPVSLPFRGTASCSAQGCHGAIEPVVQADAHTCLHNEYGAWIHDPHANAYHVLFQERSKQISDLLQSDKPEDKRKPAHEDPRCLACHTNPLLALQPQDSPLVRQEKWFGVGCESCHGSANQWLVAHTSKAWRTKPCKEKWDQHKMVPVADPARRAETCAGCHVGAPPSKDLPAREVNHDLIAAGHPRLQFEFRTFQANMVPHWRSKQTAEGHLWAVGQLVTAQAALKLLAYRAAPDKDSYRVGFDKPAWPEFAEYDCFACHHSLTGPSWRQQAIQVPPRRRPGAVPWGSWYFALLRTSTGDLQRIMQHPRPDREQAADKAQALREQLQKLQGQIAKRTRDQDDLALDRKRLLALIEDTHLAGILGWDHAEQLYLASHALNHSQADPAIAKIFDELTPLRTLPRGFDSPHSSPRNPVAFDPNRFLN